MPLHKGYIIRMLMFSFRIYRRLKFDNNQMGKQAKGLNRHFSKGDSVMAKNTCRSLNIITQQGNANLKDHEKQRNVKGT